MSLGIKYRDNGKKNLAISIGLFQSCYQLTSFLLISIMKL